MRPVITNFSSGELDPRFEGRIDLQAYANSARDLTNFFPSRIGGAFKRGGLQHKLAAPSNTYKCRMIPWNLANGQSIIVALYDGALKLIDASSDTPTYLTNSDGSDLTITSMDSTGVYPMFLDAEILAVGYAQNSGQLTLVHPNHDVFFIRINSIDTTNHYISLSYGRISLFANEAFNYPANVADVDKYISSDDISDSFRNLADGTYTPDAGSYVWVSGVKHTITSITIARTAPGTNLYLYSTGYNFQYGTAALTYPYPSALTTTKNFLVPIKKTIIHGITFPIYQRTDESTLVPIGSTYNVLIAAILNSAGAKKAFSIWGGNSGVTIPKVGDLPSTGDVYQGYLDWNPATYSITLNYSGGSVVGTSASPQQWKTYILMFSRGVAINGALVTGNEIFDSIAPWMKRDVEYQCDQTMTLNGVTPITATKMLIDGEEIISFVWPDGTDTNLIPANFTLRRTSVGLTGQVGIIITPFYDRFYHPKAVCYHQGRLCLIGSGNNLFLSKPNDHSNFSYFEDIEFSSTTLKEASEWTDQLVPETRTDLSKTQQVGASSAIRMELATDENEDINWLLSVGELVIGTATTEWIVPSGVNAMNPQATQASRNGSCALQAKFIGSSIIFASPNAKGVVSYIPGKSDSDSLISEFSASMFSGKIVAFDFRQSPTPEMYFVLDDGIVLRLVMANNFPQWSRLKLANWATGDMVEGVAIVSSLNEDAVYFNTKRIISGTTYRFIERLTTTPDDTFANRCHLDCSTYVASVAGGTVTQARFISCPVNVVFRLAGIEYRGTAITNGSGAITQYVDSITGLTTNISTLNGAEAWVGLAYTARLETFRIDTVDTEGLEKGGSSLHVRTYRSGSFKIMRGHAPTDPGYDAPMPVDATTGMTVYPYSGAVRIEHDAPDLVDQSVIIQSSDDQSVNILVLAPNYSVAVQP